MNESALGLLSRLWLREPDSATLTDSREIPTLALHVGEPDEMAAAYADLFLLNVYPYGTAFTDPSGELNGPAAARAARRYEERGYRPAELFEVGAPDHVGLGLGYLDHLAEGGGKDAELFSSLSEWVPICCLAVEREPSAHPFYRAVAATTRDQVLEGALLCHSEERASPRHSEERASPCHSEERASPCHSEERSDEESVALSKGPQIPRSARDDTTVADEEEISLSNVVRFLLAPARSGIFLSRGKIGHLARAAGMPLPFGSRFDVAHLLFQTAGENGKVGMVLDRLEEELTAWETEYRAWAAEHPRWTPASTRWLQRTAETRRRLDEMREVLENPPELESVIPER